MKDSDEYLDFLENSFSEEKSQITSLFDSQRTQHEEFVTEFRNKLMSTTEDIQEFIVFSKAEVEKRFSESGEKVEEYSKRVEDSVGLTLSNLDGALSKNYQSRNKLIEKELDSQRIAIQSQQDYIENLEKTLTDCVKVFGDKIEKNDEMFGTFASKLSILGGVIAVLLLSNLYLIIIN